MKRILITGATSGIGRACAEYLAAAGHFVIATGRNRDALQEIGALAQSRGWRLRTIPLDVTNEADIALAAAEAKRMCAEEREDCAGIDVLINNAGLGQAGFLTDIGSARLRSQFDVSLFGLFDMVNAFLPQLVENHGLILNMGSIMGRMTAPWMGAYGAVKAAVRSLTETMRVELGGLGVKVVLLEPGSVETSFHSRVVNERLHSEPARSLFQAANQWLRDNEYRPLYLMPSIASTTIARRVGRIVKARNPKPHYIVPFAARFLLFFMQATPAALLDPLKRRIFHVVPAR